MIYQDLDRSPLVRFLFHPRKSFTRPPEGARDLLVPVDDGVSVACRLFWGDPGNPWILYFHGNGEVASDYDGIAPAYHGIKANLAVAEYRGYGRSSGTPSFSALAADAHLLLQGVGEELQREYGTGEIWVMGRSLGSVSALELAAQNPDTPAAPALQGVIFESGFVSVTRLVQHLGLPRGGVDLDAVERECREKAARVAVPALVIHGEADRLVPFRQGEELFGLLGSREKILVPIPGGEHNNVMMVDLPRYFGAVEEFIHP